MTAKGVHLILVEELIQPELDDKLRYKIMFDLFDDWKKQKITAMEIVNDLNLSYTTL